MALLPVLARMRLTGVHVDRQRLEEMREDLAPKVEKVEGEIYAAAGRKFDINSWQQKQDVLYLPKDKGGQAMKPWKLSDGAKKRQRANPKAFKPTIRDWSTDADVLETFVGNPVVDALLKYQEWNKLLQHLRARLPGRSLGKEKPCRIFNDRIFADFVQYGTEDRAFSPAEILTFRTSAARTPSWAS